MTRNVRKMVIFEVTIRLGESDFKCSGRREITILRIYVFLHVIGWDFSKLSNTMMQHLTIYHCKHLNTNLIPCKCLELLQISWELCAYSKHFSRNVNTFIYLVVWQKIITVESRVLTRVTNSKINFLPKGHST